MGQRSPRARTRSGVLRRSTSMRKEDDATAWLVGLAGFELRSPSPRSAVLRML